MYHICISSSRLTPSVLVSLSCAPKLQVVEIATTTNPSIRGPSTSMRWRCPLGNRHDSPTRIPNHLFPLPLAIRTLMHTPLIFRIPSLLVICAIPPTPSNPASAPSQHARPLMRIVALILLLLQQLPLSSIVFRRRNPLPRHHARQRHADTSRSIDPRRRRTTSEFFAEEGRKVVAVLLQQIIRRAMKRLRNVFDDPINLLLRR